MASVHLPPWPPLINIPAEKLNSDRILEDICDCIRGFSKVFPDVDTSILVEQISAIRRNDVDPETLLRQSFRAFRNSMAFNDSFQKLDSDLKRKVRLFVDGHSVASVMKETSLDLPKTPVTTSSSWFRGVVHAISRLLKDSTAIKPFQIAGSPHRLPVIYEDSDLKHIMEVHVETEFKNWAESVTHKPKYTFVPTKILGLQNLVKYAKRHRLRVRCSGYRHSWSDIFSAEDQIVVSLIDLEDVHRSPNSLPIGLTPEVNGNELMTIKVLERPSWSISGKDCVRVGAAVTNEAFRRWAIDNNKCALPMDVILVEVTVGGVNAAICHGAGRRHKTISDPVVAIEYVDLNGAVQMITDPKQLKAAAGCFGLLGIVTHITFELEAMTYAVLKPKKVPITLAIPPLDMSEVPLALHKEWTEKELSAAKTDFVNRATNEYYAEWFWYTFQSTAWVNSWNTVADSEGVTSYPSEASIFLQWLQTWFGGWFSQTLFFQYIPGHWQAQFLANLGMAVLPPTVSDSKDMEIKTYLPDALHFFRGLQNTPIQSLEFEIPLPPLYSDSTKPDLSIVQRAWWDVIKLVYREAEKGRYPMRLTMELRIMGGSDILLAPQKGNDLGTASIEVLTIPNAVPEQWENFKQTLADIWMDYRAYGTKLNVRPHWAKEWMSLKRDGKPIQQYLKNVAYKDQISAFKAELAGIGKTQGWTLAELQQRFSNQLWDDIIYD